MFLSDNPWRLVHEMNALILHFPENVRRLTHSNPATQVGASILLLSLLATSSPISASAAQFELRSPSPELAATESRRQVLAGRPSNAATETGQSGAAKTDGSGDGNAKPNGEVETCSQFLSGFFVSLNEE